MADEADRAQKAEAALLQEACARRKPELLAVGFCHNCGEAIRPGLLFCADGPDCRDDYEKRRRLKAPGWG